jgi:phosphohistidine phosphatase
MSIYFVQHGIALDKSQNPARPLSDEGKQSVEKIAQFLATLNLRINQIFHSGKERAEQTAMLLASTLGVTDVFQKPHLNPTDDVNQIIPLLEDESLYVGHLPHMEKLVSRLLSGEDSPGIVQFENAAVVCIERDSDHCILKWMIRPSMLS